MKGRCFVYVVEKDDDIFKNWHVNLLFEKETINENRLAKYALFSINETKHFLNWKMEFNLMHQDLSRNLTRLISLLDWLQTPMNYIISALQGIYSIHIKRWAQHTFLTLPLIFPLFATLFLTCPFAWPFISPLEG